MTRSFESPKMPYTVADAIPETRTRLYDVAYALER